MRELCFKCGWLHQEGRYGRKCFADVRRRFDVDGTVIERELCRQCADSWHLRAQDPKWGRMLSLREEHEMEGSDER
jgi:hypothetical protein